MFEISILAIIVLFAMAVRQHKRLKRVEQELAALRATLSADVPVAEAVAGEAAANTSAPLPFNPNHERQT